MLAVDSELLRQWIRQRYLPLLRDALFEVRGQDLEVEVVVEAPAGGRTARPWRSRTTAPARGAHAAPAAGPAAALHLRGLRHGAVQPVRPGGRPGRRRAARARLQPLLRLRRRRASGKTHLLHAIGHFAASQPPGAAVTYVSVETFTNEFINALRDGGIRSFKDRYRSTDILLIDDIQSLQGREQTQEEFFHTFNALHDSGKQVVISSDRPPKAIATLEDRLRSRFEMGLITDVQPPDLETRIAILQKRVRADRYEIHEPEVLPFIAGRVSTNVRALEGALDARRRPRLDLGPPHHGRAGRPRCWRTSSPPATACCASSVIQGEVCRYYEVTLDELTGDKRTRRIVRPRQVAMYLSRELTDASLPRHRPRLRRPRPHHRHVRGPEGRGPDGRRGRGADRGPVAHRPPHRPPPRR